jgi:hypothetical protein
MIVTFGNTFTYEKILLYECKVLLNIIVKGIEILVFKGFDLVYNCVKFMLGKWCGIITHKKNLNEKIFV